MPDQTGARPDRNLAMELVRVTEYGALAAARWVGLGDKEADAGAAVAAMRLMLDTVRMDGVVVIGEGEKDEAPMLYNGERIGDGSPPQGGIAGDPLGGTRAGGEGVPGGRAPRSREPSCVRRASRARWPRSRCRRRGRCSTRARSITWRRWSSRRRSS